MLRWLLVVLVAANLAFFAWTQGWLTGLIGLSPQGDREPERLARQVQPQDIQILPPATLARRTPAPVCVEAGPFSPAELGRAETALRTALPEGSWQLITREKPGQWMVYVGPYAKPELMQRRMDDLRKRQIAFEEARNLPGYEPGLLFGRYGTEADARALQNRLTAQKVKYVRVVRLVAPTTAHTLRLPRADAQTQANLPRLREAMGARAWVACSAP
jgi:hypothetical protein